jgi:dephospho-CoA kinase
MSDLKIIGLAGTNGAGKDTVGHILAEHHGYPFVSVTDLLRKEAERQGLEPNREVLRNISAQWRRETGPGVLIDKAADVYKAHNGSYRGIVVASLRHPGEADRVHELGGRVVWVDADPRVRYDRVQKAAAERNRPAEDNKTFEQFQEEEAVEMKQQGDAATVNMSAVKERADITLDNDEGGVEQFRSEVEQALNL